MNNTELKEELNIILEEGEDALTFESIEVKQAKIVLMNLKLTNLLEKL
jgi:hypothetical protein